MRISDWSSTWALPIYPAEAIEEGFFGIVTPFEIGVHDALDAVGNLVARQRTAHALAHRRAVGRRAAEHHLVPLLATLVDAEDADVADAVLAAAVHATAHGDADRADVILIVEIGRAHV